MFRSYSGSKDRREDDIWLQLTIVHLFTLDTHSKLLAFMNLKIKIKEKKKQTEKQQIFLLSVH